MLFYKRHLKFGMLVPTFFSFFSKPNISVLASKKDQLSQICTLSAVSFQDASHGYQCFNCNFQEMKWWRLSSAIKRFYFPPGTAGTMLYHNKQELQFQIEKISHCLWFYDVRTILTFFSIFNEAVSNRNIGETQFQMQVKKTWVIKLTNCLKKNNIFIRNEWSCLHTGSGQNVIFVIPHPFQFSASTPAPPIWKFLLCL